MTQLSIAAKEELEKQHYRVIGMHSAVKICGWTKSMIRGKGGCYKLKFYGIMSHQCMQMTTSISCANRCRFCWRGYKAPVSKEWNWDIDPPEKIFEESMHAHHGLLTGFGGSKDANKRVYHGSKTIKHVALSLTGEPIMYPRINELIDMFHHHHVSTFLVTNAQYPEQIRDLKPITQLYISLDAPDKETLKWVDVPLFKDYWERLNKGLEYLAQKKQRTTIRLTLMKDVNMNKFDEYAALIRKGDPDFIEAKAYMFVGESRNRMQESNMPTHAEVIAFSQKLLQAMPDYEIVSDHPPSFVVMMAKKQYKKNGKWHTWINFKKFHELATNKKQFTTEDYLLPTPQVGLEPEEKHFKRLKILQ